MKEVETTDYWVITFETHLGFVQYYKGQSRFRFLLACARAGQEMHVNSDFGAGTGRCTPLNKEDNKAAEQALNAGRASNHRFFRQVFHGVRSSGRYINITA